MSQQTAYFPRILLELMRFGLVSMFALGVVGPCALTGKTLEPPTDPRVAKILAAWQKRQQAIENITATLNVHVGKCRVPGRPGATSSKGLPENPIEYDVKHFVIMDFARERCRFEKEGGIYDTGLQKILPQMIKSVLSKGEGKTYWHYPKSQSGRFHTGKVGGRIGFYDMELREGTVGPLFLFAGRCQVPEILLADETLQGLKIVDVAKHGDSTVLECRGSNPQAFFGVPTRGTLWLDETRDYVIRRMERTDSLFRAELTIEYGPRTEFGWVPQSATYVMIIDGVIEETTRTRFDEVQFNSPLDDSQFDFVFPEGTLIENLQRRGPTLVADKEGQPVPSDPIAGSSASPSDSQGRSMAPWIIGANVLVVLVLAVWLMLRAR